MSRIRPLDSQANRRRRARDLLTRENVAGFCFDSEARALRSALFWGDVAQVAPLIALSLALYSFALFADHGAPLAPGAPEQCTDISTLPSPHSAPATGYSTASQETAPLPPQLHGRF